jgi:hypothetical protein
VTFALMAWAPRPVFRALRVYGDSSDLGELPLRIIMIRPENNKIAPRTVPVMHTPAAAFRHLMADNES